MHSTLIIQTGPVGEVGVNGDQVDDIIRACRDLLREFNVPPHNNRQTSLAITKLEEATFWLRDRTEEREARGVEGTSAP